MRLYGKAIQISKMRPEPLGFNSVIFHEQEEACLEFRNSAPSDVPAHADAQPSQDLAWKNELPRERTSPIMQTCTIERNIS